MPATLYPWFLKCCGSVVQPRPPWLSRKLGSVLSGVPHSRLLTRVVLGLRPVRKLFRDGRHSAIWQ